MDGEQAAARLALAQGSADPADARAAVRTWRRLIARTPAGHPEWAALQSGLCVALRVRIEATGNLADLDEAVRAARLAVAATPDDHPNHASSLFTHASLLLTRFGRHRLGPFRVRRHDRAGGVIHEYRLVA